MTKKTLLIPFDADGHMIPWCAETPGGPLYDWRPAMEFSGPLRFSHLWHDGSITFLNDMDKRLSMFYTDAKKIVPLLIEGTLTGAFNFRKQGQGFGIVYVAAETE